MAQEPAAIDDVLVKTEARSLHDLLSKAEDRLNVFVEPPEIDAQQKDGWRPRWRKRKAEVVQVAEAVEHPTGVVKRGRLVPEHRCAKLHGPGGTGDENGRILLDDPAVL